jgi:hypothetical protein
MKSPEADIRSAEATSDARDESTGLPLFRTWRGVYLFAFGCFVLYVVVLTVFSRTFS